MIVPLLTVRADIATYLSALITVYTIVIFAYIISTLAFTLGVRIPYNRGSDAVLGFLRNLSEPYLSIFRRVIPPIGMFDFSPIIAILLLQIGGSIIVSLIRG